ncbi:hypothetical protein EXIGLDRAFT_761552 [Exidia glandulosa HHB12029]|uniref:Zn(2)-C6 fungal-type domain-containing protein n=1 Tax=Exidia glandulosa HHB12029 TaxID=1314781 RepID=A0A165NHA7_EXIGL|nr:hypothetical protein EXIGLDRAFT_761552 [Exidia glandulosa HHB12029]
MVNTDTSKYEYRWPEDAMATTRESSSVPAPVPEGLSEGLKKRYADWDAARATVHAQVLAAYAAYDRLKRAIATVRNLDPEDSAEDEAKAHEKAAARAKESRDAVALVVESAKKLDILRADVHRQRDDELMALAAAEEERKKAEEEEKQKQKEEKKAQRAAGKAKATGGATASESATASGSASTSATGASELRVEKCKKCVHSGTVCSGPVPAGATHKKPGKLGACTACKSRKTKCEFPGRPPFQTSKADDDDEDVPQSPKKNRARASSPVDEAENGEVEGDDEPEDEEDEGIEGLPMDQRLILEMGRVNESLRYMSDSLFQGTPGDDAHDGMSPGAVVMHLGNIAESSASLYDISTEMRKNRIAMERVAGAMEVLVEHFTGSLPPKRKADGDGNPKKSKKPRTEESTMQDDGSGEAGGSGTA